MLKNKAKSTAVTNAAEYTNAAVNNLSISCVMIFLVIPNTMLTVIKFEKNRHFLILKICIMQILKLCWCFHPLTSTTTNSGLLSRKPNYKQFVKRQ